MAENDNLYPDSDKIPEPGNIIDNKISNQENEHHRENARTRSIGPSGKTADIIAQVRASLDKPASGSSLLSRMEAEIAAMKRDSTPVNIDHVIKNKSIEEKARREQVEKELAWQAEYFARPGSKAREALESKKTVQSPTLIENNTTTQQPKSIPQPPQESDESPGPGWVKNGNRWVFRGNKNSISDAVVSIDHEKRPDVQPTPKTKTDIPTPVNVEKKYPSLEPLTPYKKTDTNVSEGNDLRNQLVGEAVKQTWKTLSPKTYTRASQALDMYDYGKEIYSTVRKAMPTGQSGSVSQVGELINVKNVATTAARMIGIGELSGAALVGGGIAGGIAAAGAIAIGGGYLAGKSALWYNRQVELSAINQAAEGGILWQNASERRPDILAYGRYQNVNQRGLLGGPNIDEMLNQRVRNQTGYEVTMDRRVAAWDRLMMKNLGPLQNFVTGGFAGFNMLAENAFNAADLSVDFLKNMGSAAINDLIKMLPPVFGDTLRSIAIAAGMIANIAKNEADKKDIQQQEESGNLDAIFYNRTTVPKGPRLPPYKNPKNR